MKTILQFILENPSMTIDDKITLISDRVIELQRMEHDFTPLRKRRLKAMKLLQLNKYLLNELIEVREKNRSFKKKFLGGGRYGPIGPCQ